MNKKEIPLDRIIGFVLIAGLVMASVFYNYSEKEKKRNLEATETFNQAVSDAVAFGHKPYDALMTRIKSDYSLILPIYHYLKEIGGDTLSSPQILLNSLKIESCVNDGGEKLFNEFVCHLKNKEIISKSDSCISLKDKIEYILSNKNKDELDIYYKTGEEIVKECGHSFQNKTPKIVINKESIPYAPPPIGILGLSVLLALLIIFLFYSLFHSYSEKRKKRELEAKETEDVTTVVAQVPREEENEESANNEKITESQEEIQ